MCVCVGGGGGGFKICNEIYFKNSSNRKDTFNFDI